MKNRYIKLASNRTNVKFRFPKDFNELNEKIKNFLPLENINKRYQIINPKSNTEIKNQEDFLKICENSNEKKLKLKINIFDKNEKYLNEKYFSISINNQFSYLNNIEDEKNKNKKYIEMKQLLDNEINKNKDLVIKIILLKK